MNAFELQTKDYTHVRPPIELGDLSGPEGNAFIVNGRVNRDLVKRKFHKEAAEFSHLVFSLDPNYDRSFDKIAFFFNLAPAPKIIDLNSLASLMAEEGDNLVIKISKKDIIANQRQIEDYNESLYITNSVSKSTTNYLGRNISFYFSSLQDTASFSPNEIRKLISSPDYGECYAYMQVFSSDEEGNISTLLNKTLLFKHLIEHHASQLNLSATDIFDRNMLTQLFIFSENMDKINKNDVMFYEALYTMRHCVRELAKLPNFTQALEHNTTRFNKYCLKSHTMCQLLGEAKLTIPAKYLAQIEKMQLNLEINKSDKQTSVLKI